LIYKEGSDPVSRKKKEALQGIIYVLPSFILIMAFCIIPIFMSGYFSFTSYNIMTPPKFVGLENYERVFQDGYVADAAKNTLLYVLMTVPAQTILSLVFAAFLAYKMQNKTGGFLRSVMFIPVIASAVTAGTIWRIILNTEGGLLNNILNFFHLDSVNWLGSTKTALISICIVAVWKNVGYFLVIYYAGIMGISKDLYEAAKVDGATSIQQFFKITLPMLKPITYLVVTLGIIWSFQVFDLAYLMTGGGPGRATVTLVMGIYNAAFKQYKMGYACAMAMLLLLIVVIINVIENLFFKERKGK
jgi:multiple sugar transport system permease protein